MLYYYRRSVCQSVFVSSTHLGLKTTFLFLSDSCGFVDVGYPLWREDASVFYNVQYIYILHVISWMFIQYIQGLCQSGLSTADHAHLSSFRLWILVIILLHQIWDNFCNGYYFLLLWHSTIELCHCYAAATILNILLSRGKLFIFGAPTDWPVACCSCWCKGAGTLGSIVTVWALYYDRRSVGQSRLD
jgi:hypothetical protein